jgi:hypothetical protein
MTPPHPQRRNTPLLVDFLVQSRITSYSQSLPFGRCCTSCTYIGSTNLTVAARKVDLDFCAFGIVGGLRSEEMVRPIGFLLLLGLGRMAQILSSRTQPLSYFNSPPPVQVFMRLLIEKLVFLFQPRQESLNFWLINQIQGGAKERIVD